MKIQSTVSGPHKAIRLLLGAAGVVIGVPLAGIMTVAVCYEIVAGDFFGLCIGGMVVLFGLLLTRSGIDLLLNRNRRVPPGALDDLWQTEQRVDLYLPYARVDIRGR